MAFTASYRVDVGDGEILTAVVRKEDWDKAYTVTLDTHEPGKAIGRIVLTEEKRFVAERLDGKRLGTAKDRTLAPPVDHLVYAYWDSKSRGSAA